MCGKVAEIWKERTRPMRATFEGEVLVMSSPIRVMAPAVGCRNLVSS